jgi:glycosyltransferase involved in cell wall biosynthesis
MGNDSRSVPGGERSPRADGRGADGGSLSVLMPVFNERATVEEAIQRVLDAELPVTETEIVVVDDGSTDGTAEILAQRDWPERVRVVAHERNRGKGAAIRTALRHAEGDYSAIMDADLEYDPTDLRPLLEAVMSGEFNAVYGTRGFESHSAYSFWYVLGNRAVTLAANVLYNSWLSDIMTCHKVMRTDLFRSLELRENGFAIEPEITARLLRAGIRIYEVPISYRARSRPDGKKLTSVDGFRVLRTLVRCRLS